MALQYLQEEPTSSLYLSNITWNDEKHALVIGNRIVTLTATEYRLLSPLRHGAPIKYSTLASIAYQCTFNEKVRIMMDKHIDRIRCKLRGTGVYVYCMMNYGYMLLPEV